jgi:aquaporin Z
MTPPPDRPLHGAPFPPGRLHPRLYLAEFAGTALLVLLDLSVVIALFGEGSPCHRCCRTPGCAASSRGRCSAVSAR